MFTANCGVMVTIIVSSVWPYELPSLGCKAINMINMKVGQMCIRFEQSHEEVVPYSPLPIDAF